jgi:hypothetical protein
VDGPSLYLEVDTVLPKLGATPPAIEIADVVEILAANKLTGMHPGPESTSCLVDAACATTANYDALNILEPAVGYMTFIHNGAGYQCTGTILNNSLQSDIPYFLTANHCIPSQAEASTLNVFFDYRAASCLGPEPPLGVLPSTYGSVLLATAPYAAGSDFAFLRLNSLPAGRHYMGWDARSSSVTPGVVLHRVSHPLQFSQGYSESAVAAVPNVCPPLNPPNFIFSNPTVGSVFHGSSGGAVALSGGFVVGQLFGVCQDLGDPCAFFQQIDGAFSQTFPFVAQWLAPAAPPCVPSSTTLCLNGGRFTVTTTFQSSSGSGNGTAVPLSGDTGYFWFFGPSNLEMVVKVLDACGLNGKKWVFAGGLTDVNVVLTVTDTFTGAVRTYVNPQSTAFVPVQDTSAFSTCP